MPENPDILLNIAGIYEKTGMKNEALFMYSRVVEMFPMNEQAKLRLKDFQAENKPQIKPANILNLDITEFPFHKDMEQVKYSETPTNIVIPKPVYSAFGSASQGFPQIYDDKSLK